MQERAALDNKIPPLPSCFNSAASNIRHLRGFVSTQILPNSTTGNVIRICTYNIIINIHHLKAIVKMFCDFIRSDIS